eukprot:c24003_g1_i1 orf=403-1884(+)
MMGDDSDDDKPLLFQFKNSKGSVQAKCFVRDGAANSLQKSRERLSKNAKGSDDGDDDKPLKLMFSSKFSERASQISTTVVDESPSTTEKPPNGVAAKVGVSKPAPVKVYTKRKKQLDDEARDNVVAKKLKSSNCGAADVSSRDRDDVDDDYDIPLRAIPSSDRKKHTSGVSGCHVVESRNVSVTLSTSAACLKTSKEKEGDKDDVGMKTGEDKGDDVDNDDTNAGKNRECKENGNDDDSVDVDDANGTRDHDADVDDANGGRDHDDDKHDSNGAGGSTIVLSKQLDVKKRKLADATGNGMDDPRLSCDVAHTESKSSDTSSKLPARVDLVKEEDDDDDDDLPLSNLPRVKRNKDPAIKDMRLPNKMSAVKEENDGDGYDLTLSKHLDTKRKKHADEKVTQISRSFGNVSENRLKESAKKKEIDVHDANDDHDVPAGKSLIFKREKDSDVKEGVPGKGADMRAGVLCKSRAQQLIALSKSLDIDSEEDEEEDDE